jgi:hypothetical protein
MLIPAPEETKVISIGCPILMKGWFAGYVLFSLGAPIGVVLARD